MNFFVIKVKCEFILKNLKTILLKYIQKNMTNDKFTRAMIIFDDFDMVVKEDKGTARVIL